MVKIPSVDFGQIISNSDNFIRKFEEVKIDTFFCFTDYD